MPVSDSFCLLCAGIGPYLRVYALNSQTLSPDPDNDSIQLEKQVFPHGIRIHGIVPGSPMSSDKALALRGGRLVASVDVVLSERGIPIDVVFRVRHFSHWVFDAKYLVTSREFEDAELAVIAVGVADGSIHICDCQLLNTLKIVQCPISELLWSITLRDTNNGLVRAAAGTSFGEIILCDFRHRSLEHAGCEGNYSQHLTGHDGCVVHTAFSDDHHLSWLASASVDRSVRIWRQDAQYAENADQHRPRYLPYCKFYGHTARVWQVAFAPTLKSFQPGVQDRALSGDLPPPVLSVGEDKSLRIWHSSDFNDERNRRQNHQQPPGVFFDHSGRNVWVLSVTQSDHPNSDAISVATGGDDGRIQLRDISKTGAVRGSSQNVASARRNSTGVQAARSDIADMQFPRQSRPGQYDESVQAIVVRDKSTVIVSTSYGRILVGCRELASWKWSVAYHSAEDVVFAPHSLTLSRGVVIAGTTVGNVMAVRIDGVQDCSGNLVTKFVAFGALRQLTLSIFVFERNDGESSLKRNVVASCDDVVDIMIASGDGSLFHWHVHGLHWQNYPRRACFVAKYTMERPVRHGQVTSVLVLRDKAELVLVGDRRGYIHVYKLHRVVCDEPKEPLEHTVDRICYPLCYRRVHKDRVSSMTRLPNTAERCIPPMLTAGFDGRLVTVNIRSANADCIRPDECESELSLETGSFVRCSEHLDTILDVACLSHCGSTASSDILQYKPIVTGFRAAQLVLFDIVRRAVILRVDLGGWRRALGLHVDIVDAKSSRFRNVDGVLAAYWRAGSLHVLQTRPHHVLSLGVGFHGLRAHALSVLEDGETIVSGSEDTLMYAMNIGRGLSANSWKIMQSLSDHISAISCVCSRSLGPGHRSNGKDSSSGSVLLSGGGMDELCLWHLPRESSTWVLQQKVYGRVKHKALPRHRVMSATFVRFSGLREFGGGINSMDRDIIAIAGRSDGSVALIRIDKVFFNDPPVEPLFCMTELVRKNCHQGAVLSVASTSQFPGRNSVDRDAEQCATVATGDSAGEVFIWTCKPSGELCLMSSIRNAHKAGVNSLAVLSVDDCTEILASAGDDEAVRLRCVQRGLGTKKENCQIFYEHRHAAAAVGVALVWLWSCGVAVISVGADQTVLAQVVDISISKAEVVCQRGEMIEMITDVADPAGLIVLSDEPVANTKQSSSVRIAVYGCGLQVLNLEFVSP